MSFKQLEHYISIDDDEQILNLEVVATEEKPRNSCLKFLKIMSNDLLIITQSFLMIMLNMSMLFIFLSLLYTRKYDLYTRLIEFGLTLVILNSTQCLSGILSSKYFFV